VEYTLYLVKATSDQGEWKVGSVRCLSLEASPSRPYTTTLDASREQNRANLSAETQAQLPNIDFDRRNDRQFK
jgi:hypothetical protein